MNYFKPFHKFGLYIISILICLTLFVLPLYKLYSNEGVCFRCCYEWGYYGCHIEYYGFTGCAMQSPTCCYHTGTMCYLRGGE